MLSIETEARLSKLFLNLADGEKAVEASRHVLNEQLDFDAYHAFKRLDTDQKNTLDEYNIVNFLKINGTYCSFAEARSIISFYDLDTDRKLNYSEFLNLILSDSNYSLRRIAREKCCVYEKHTLPYDVEYSLSKVLERELDLIRNLEIILTDLRSRRDFNVYDLYSSIQSYNDISSDDLAKFLLRNDACFDNNDIKAIMKRLDLDKDMRINLSEFRKFLNCPSSVKDTYTYKSDLSSAKSTLNESKLSSFRTTSPLRCTTSPIRSYSPLRSARYESPCNSPKKTVESPRRITTRSPYRSPYRSPVRSPYRSPVRAIKSPERITTLRSPVRSPVRLNCYSHHCYKTYHCYPLKCYNTCEDETFNSYIKEVIETENSTERAKSDLIIRNDFNVEDVFRVFELDSRGYLTELDLKYGLHALDIYPTSSEVSLLFKKFDWRSEGVIYYDHFFEQFAPVDSEYRKMLELRLPNGYTPRNKPDVFSTVTKIGVKEFFNLLIQSESRIEALRQRLNKMINFNVRRYFEKIDRLNKNYLSETDFSDFLRCSDIIFFSKDIKLLTKRFDKDNDGRVTYLEFSNEVLPHSKDYFI